MEQRLKKIGFNKTDNNKWVHCNDYVLNTINPKYGYYLYATIHIPKKYTDSLENNFSKIVVHRCYDLQQWNKGSEYYDYKVVYEGVIDTEEYLELLLIKLGIIETPMIG